jgi:hypothetical protein
LIKFWAGRIEEFYDTEKEKGKKRDLVSDSNKSRNQFDSIDGDNQFLFLDLTSLEIEVLKNFEQKGVQAFLELFDKKYDKVSGPLIFAVFYRNFLPMYVFTLTSFDCNIIRVFLGIIAALSLQSIAFV